MALGAKFVGAAASVRQAHRAPQPALAPGPDADLLLKPKQGEIDAALVAAPDAEAEAEAEAEVAMLLLIVARRYMTKKDIRPKLTELGIEHGGTIYIPVVVAMAAQQAAVAAVRGVPVALLSAFGALALCTCVIAAINRTGHAPDRATPQPVLHDNPLLLETTPPVNQRCRRSGPRTRLQGTRRGAIVWPCRRVACSTQCSGCRSASRLQRGGCWL